MFNITNCYRNTNPIYTKVSPHSSQNDHQQNVNKQSINQDGGVEGRALFVDILLMVILTAVRKNVAKSKW